MARDEWVRVRVTRAERAWLEGRAAAEDVPMSHVVRRLVAAARDRDALAQQVATPAGQVAVETARVTAPRRMSDQHFYDPKPNGRCQAKINGMECNMPRNHRSHQ